MQTMRPFPTAPVPESRVRAMTATVNEILERSGYSHHRAWLVAYTMGPDATDAWAGVATFVSRAPWITY